MQKLSRSLLLTGALAVAGLAGCGDDVTVNPVVDAVTSVTVSPSNASAKVGDKIQLSANVQTTGKGDKTVKWTTSSAAVATVDGNGLVTAVAAGTASITATSNSDASKASSAIVTVTGVSKGVKNVTVSPNAQTLTPGATLQAVANVDADAGVARTVTWASSNNAVATVTNAGVITAVAAGTATITATSTVDNTVSGALALTVAQAAQPTVSIKSVTRNAAGLQQPVDLNNVAGQIDITLNLDAAGQQISKVAVLIDDKEVASQTFAGADVSPAAAGSEIVISVATNKFDAATGAVSFTNGARKIKAVLTTKSGSTTQSASVAQDIVLRNVSGFVGTLATNGRSANSAAGLTWKSGDLTVNAIPVLYGSTAAPFTVPTVASATISFGTCDASPTGTRSRAAALSGSAWTVSFAGGQATAANPAAANNVRNYEQNGAACGGQFGETPSITAVGSDGNNIVLIGAGGFLNSPYQAAGAGTTPDASFAVRLDNRAPGAPTFMANPNNRQNGWINGAVALSGSYNAATNPNGWLANGTADAGVGGYTRFVRIGAGTSVDAALAAAASDTPALPAPSAGNDSYCAVISARDLLGNESALPAAGTACTAPQIASNTAVAAQHLSFGVDIAAPVIAFAPNGAGRLAANARLNGATITDEFVVSVQDTGTVGNSGMLSGAAVMGTVLLRNQANPTSTGAAACVLGAFTVQGGCAPTSASINFAFPLASTSTIGAIAGEGYFTYSAFAQDAAGNQSAPITRVVAHNAAANVPALTTALFNTPLNGSTVVFNANASSNFDLRDVTYTMTYAGGLAGPIQYPAVVLNTYNTAPLVNSNVAAGITVNGFMRQVEAVTGVNPLAAAGGVFKPTQLSGVVRDQANNSSAAVNTAIPGASVTNGVSYLAAPAAQLINSWAIVNAATNVSDGAPVAPAVPANPLSVTLNADVFGPTATFNPPFTRVDFYAVSAGNLVQIGSATGVSTVDDGSPNGRRHRYSITWTPGTAFGVGAQSIYAIGVNAAGDALVTQVSNAITVTKP